jgi:hypothetical protein
MTNWQSPLVLRRLQNDCSTNAGRRAAVADPKSPFYQMSLHALKHRYFRTAKEQGWVPSAVPDTKEDDQEIKELRKSLNHTQRQLQLQKQRTDLLVEAAHRGAFEASLVHAPKPVAAPPKTKRSRNKSEVALWHMGDWQGSKISVSYNSGIMRERVLRFTDRAIEITDIHRAHHPVDECVILFGGDMVEGLFNFPRQVFEIDSTLFQQWVTVSRLLQDVVLAALGNYQKVKVIAEWGNHGRIGSKRDVVPPSDNVDRMCYEFARQLLDRDKYGGRLVWEDCPDDIQQVEIGNYRALLMHGDEAGRNGFVSAQTMISHVNRWKAGAYPWDFRDVYLSHYHRHAQEPLANGEGAIFWTASTESDNRYAREQMAASAVPSQRLHFIDPLKGRVTSQYQVWVD